MRKPLVIIENWAVVQSAGFDSFQELQLGKRLTGNVFGHPNLPNTNVIYTSPIVSVDLSQGVVETLNTAYQLGKPSDAYKTWEHKRREAEAA
jgi:hypothetical protein